VAKNWLGAIFFPGGTGIPQELDNWLYKSLEFRRPDWSRFGTILRSRDEGGFTHMKYSSCIICFGARPGSQAVILQIASKQAGRIASQVQPDEVLKGDKKARILVDRRRDGALAQRLFSLGFGQPMAAHVFIARRPAGEKILDQASQV